MDFIDNWRELPLHEQEQYLARLEEHERQLQAQEQQVPWRQRGRSLSLPWIQRRGSKLSLGIWATIIVSLLVVLNQPHVTGGTPAGHFFLKVALFAIAFGVIRYVIRNPVYALQWLAGYVIGELLFNHHRHQQPQQVQLVDSHGHPLQPQPSTPWS